MRDNYRTSRDSPLLHTIDQTGLDRTFAAIAHDEKPQLSPLADAELIKKQRKISIFYGIWKF
jgi:hypothetical protein